jgi:fatty-acyl-CoA synthase
MYLLTSGGGIVGSLILNFGQMLESHARLRPAKIGVRDLERSLTFVEWDRRANRLANALSGLGLTKGARVGVLAYNCIEWAEIYAAVAKNGLIAVPVNFRLSTPEIQYILEDAGVEAIIAQHGLHELIDDLREALGIAAERHILFGTGNVPSDWRDYQTLIGKASDSPPGVLVLPEDPWTLMYTSGTTGRPKGVIRSHRGMAMLSLVTEVEVGVRNGDDALLVMPMCHANSLNFFCSFSYCGGTITIYSRKNFDAGHALDVLAKSGCTFTSLVPTHYIMLLSLSSKEKQVHDLGRMRKLMISSAAARAETKRSIMEMFPSSGLFELYGSSEAGWVTMLHPEEQFTHLGTVGRECVGSGPIRLLDEGGAEVTDGTPGELFSMTPYTFDGYWNQPDKTREAFNGQACTVGDMAIRDEDGFIRLVDRKKNMIISGGENIYPSEVEAVLGAAPQVRDVAVIGLPDDKWGEAVHAVVVLHEGETPNQQDLIQWCNGRIAGYKRPRSISFIDEADMPRTATGKVLHRVLRDTVGRALLDTGNDKASKGGSSVGIAEDA